ncbi:MAG: glycosyltransferase family 4 protein [Flavobacteriales bacterium]
MRILQLCNKPPYPPIDGGSKAMYNITRGLVHAGHEVKVLCISTKKHPLKVGSVPQEFRDATRIEGVFVDTSLNIVDAFTDLVTADNYNISRFFSPDMDIRLIQLLSQETFDVIHLESLFMTPYIPTLRRYSKARIVLRSHNLEHMVQERIAKGERNLLKKPYRKFLARQLRSYEKKVLSQLDGVVAITSADAGQMAAHHGSTPITTVPFSLDLEDYVAPQAGGPLVFFHLGSMDWLPNEEGVRWLLRAVWPRVLKVHPTAKLHLAGNGMPKDMIRARLPGTKVVGRVADANRYIAERHVMVVPLFSAGGMRVKIIEGMAMGKCVVSTTVGAEGIAYTAGRDILLADTAAEFAQQMVRLLEEPGTAARIGNNARFLVAERHSTGKAINDLVAFYTSIIAA